jgi:hypothetical protein
MKVFIFSDTHWSLGRVHRDVMKYLNHEVQYMDWDGYSWNDFVKNYMWCDKCITNLITYKTLKSSFSNLDLKKCIFVSHGFVEHEKMEYDKEMVYGMTSDAILPLFPSYISPFLMPNGVDPENFNYKPKDGYISTLGWCGADHVWWKQVNWAHDISNKTNIPLKLATKLSYDELKDWYNTIDLLLVTAVPNAYQETGPLPPFEAIVSGVPVIGTPVGNFRHVPGPKFKTVEEGVNLIKYFKEHPEELKELAKRQYDFVINNFSYRVLAPYWEAVITAKNGNS